MDIATLQMKIDKYRAREDDLVARLHAATTDAQRFEIERMRRLTQVVFLSLLSSVSVRHEASRSHHPA